MGILEVGIGNVNHVMIKLRISINCIVYKNFPEVVFLFDDQRGAPLFAALIKHARQNSACFHIPGHGQAGDCRRN